MALTSLSIDVEGWTSAVELRQLRALLAVVDHGSISAAAVVLGLAQSTVSEALAALERATGTLVLRRKRGAHGIALTDAGSALLPHAHRMIEELEAMHAAVARVTQSALGQIRLSANESVSTYLLGPALSVLRKQWPMVRFSVTVGTCPVVRSAIADDRADFGLLLEENTPRGTTAHRSLIPESAFVVAPTVALMRFARSDHPLLRHDRPHSTDELAQYSIYFADSAGDFHDLVARHFAADRLPGPRLESAGSIEGVKRGVADDESALGLLPAYALAEEVAQGKLCAITVRPPPPMMRLVALASSSGAGAHPLAQKLLAALRSASLVLLRGTQP